VPLFQCNPTNAVAKTHIPELFSVANFGSDPAAGFKALAAVQQGAADVRRILFRLVRHLGRAAPPRRRRQGGGRHRPC
jgi:hypothetical protein